jgi:site-specific DNA-methyltransferase (adenine-specific)
MGFVGPQRSLDDWTRENHAPGDKWWAEFKQTLTPEQWGAVERRVVGEKAKGSTSIFGNGRGTAFVSESATDQAKHWSGWGTALKPAHEPIVLARKPLIRNVAENVLEHGTGGLNIDGCRIEIVATERGVIDSRSGAGFGTIQCEFAGREEGQRFQSHSLGRWPANVILSYPEDEYVLRSNVTPEQKKELFKWLYENA